MVSTQLSTNSMKKMSLKINDIIFREVQIQDIEYLIDPDYAPPKLRNNVDETVVDISEWRQTLINHNIDDELIKGMMVRKVVGVACFYRQQEKIVENPAENAHEIIQLISAKKKSSLNKNFLYKKYDD